MNYSLSSLSVSIIVISLTTGCATSSKDINTPPAPIEKTKKTYGSTFIENTEPMASAKKTTDSALLLKPNKKSKELKIKKNQSLKLTRSEQIQLALGAAKSDHVKPMLMDRPTNYLVYFKFSDYLLEDTWLPILKKHANYISSEVSARLIVAGFTDKKGTPKFNYNLGKKRSNEVCKILVSYGVRKEQLTCLSYGETHLVDSGDDEGAHARNRRVELIY